MIQYLEDSGRRASALERNPKQTGSPSVKAWGLLEFADYSCKSAVLLKIFQKYTVKFYPTAWLLGWEEFLCLSYSRATDEFLQFWKVKVL